MKGDKFPGWARPYEFNGSLMRTHGHPEEGNNPIIVTLDTTPLEHLITLSRLSPLYHPYHLLLLLLLLLLLHTHTIYFPPLL